MEIIEVSKDDIFSQKELPDYIFKRRYNYYYFLVDDLMNNSSNYDVLVNGISNLLNDVHDSKVYISKLHNQNYQEAALEFVIRKHSIEKDFEWVINYTVSIQGQVVFGRLGAPYSNPTIMYSDSGKWGLYYKYEDNLILIGSDYSITDSLKSFSHIVIEFGQVKFNDTEDVEFYRCLISEYTKH